MPKFTFECTCGTQFTRSLNQGEHRTHICPQCGTGAARVWESFGFNFATVPTKAIGNSGVTKHDYPTADQAVGRSADTRWAEYREREKVKNKVRQVGGTRALVRSTGEDYVEYSAASPKTIETRRKVIRDANAITKASNR